MTLAMLGLAALQAFTAPPLALSPAPPPTQPPTPHTASSASSAARPSSTVAVPAFRQANNVAVLTVEGVIDQVTLSSLERRMKQAVADGADAVVLDLDTPGGDAFVTLDICNLLKDRNDTPANVVAWIHPEAYSAGTFMALACREIVVAPNASFGDAAPIQAAVGQLMSLPPAERAKLEAPFLGEVVDSARRHHYDEKLVQAFISVGVELWLLENASTGEQIFVDRVEYKTVFGEEPPTQTTSITPSITPSGTPTQNAPTRAVKPWVSKIPDARPSDEGPGLTPEELQEQIEQQQELPSVRPDLTAQDRGQWSLVRQVDSADRLLVVKSDDAMHYGLAQAVIANDTELQRYFGAQTIRRYDATWSEGLVRLLISWPVKALLIIVFLIGLFVEMAAPGFGVFGGAAIVALLLLVGAPALAGLSQWWDVLLVLLGIALIAMELFVLPGLGVAGVAGVICLLVGLVGTFVSGDITSTAGQEELWTGLITTLTSVFIAGVIMWMISRQMHSFPLIQRLILNTQIRNPDADDHTSAGTGLLEAMAAPQRALQVGDLGRVETDLRPSGRASFNGRLVDVNSIGGYIDRGTPIRVVSVGRFVIEVEEAVS